ncbi:cytosolic phosphoglycerate kinase 2 [Artemisia annua]|uniref:Phosphoglycerate kinase n=1 Tax=Artemisia annua TaxID=35608 RepID=A0A2U1MHP3_ARTAN|nr:cytosolic phosphoglycerate kinase 2 [Artemisia annua]
MGLLTSELAKESYEKNKPFKHGVVESHKDANHALVITGIHTDGKPENHFVEIKNSYGLGWGHKGYAKVAFSFIKMIMIPCMKEKKVNSSSVIKMATKKSVSSLNDSDLKGKRVFFRADLNVPLDDRLEIADDTLIHVFVPAIKRLMSNGARVIVSSHMV